MAQSKLIGRRFGKLTVVRVVGRKNYPFGTRLQFECLCDCGATTLAESGSIHNRKSCGCIMRRAPGEVAFNQLLLHYRRAAVHRGLKWKLTTSDFRKLIQSNCFYCGVAPSRTYKPTSSKDTLTCNGVDRRDSAVGYLKRNCVSCCSRCNMAKGVMSAEAFIELAVCIASHHSTKRGAP